MWQENENNTRCNEGKLTIDALFVSIHDLLSCRGCRGRDWIVW